MLIAIEGIDGSGTTTQANALVNYLLNARALGKSPHSAYEVQHLHFPEDNSPIGSITREYLKGKYTSTSHTSLIIDYLCLAERAQWADDFQKQPDNVVTIIERYTWSSIAYGANDVGRFNELVKANSPFPKPDLLIYLDVSPDIALSRISARGLKTELYEKEEELKRVYNNFDRLIGRYECTYPDGSLKIVDGRKPVDFVSLLIAEAVNKCLFKTYSKRSSATPISVPVPLS